MMALLKSNQCNLSILRDLIASHLISSVHLILSNHIHKKATNFAVLSELGRFPLHFDIIKSKIRYWYRLENLGSSFPLLRLQIPVTVKNSFLVWIHEFFTSKY